MRGKETTAVKKKREKRKRKRENDVQVVVKDKHLLTAVLHDVVAQMADEPRHGDADEGQQQDGPHDFFTLDEKVHRGVVAQKERKWQALDDHRRGGWWLPCITVS